MDWISVKNESPPHGVIIVTFYMKGTCKGYDIGIFNQNGKWNGSGSNWSGWELKCWFALNEPSCVNS